MPRIARRVVCGRSETIATLRADDRVDQRRLADVGPAGEPDEAGRGSSPQLAAIAARAQCRGLQREHLALVGLVVVAAEVEDAVDGGLGHVAGSARGRSRRRRARAGPAPARPVDREGEHVGRLVLAAVLAVQLADPRSASTSSTARWPSSTPAARSAAAAAGRSSRGTSARSRPVNRRSARCSRCVLAVGGDDPLDELVADDVLAAEADEGDVLRPRRGSRRRRPGPSAGRSAGRSG